MPVSGKDASIRHRWSNFDYARLLAAAAVIFSHSFLIADGNEAREPLTRLLGAHNILGGYGVLIFFGISGYLVTRSAQRSDVASFALKRFLRIYPGLFVCLLVTAVVLGAAFTDKAASAYLLSGTWLRYLVQTMTWYRSGTSIPTVSFYRGEPGAVINGSLWTIPQEIGCYLVVGGLLATKSLRLPIVLLLFLALEVAVLFDLVPSNVLIIVRDFFFGAPSFFAGSFIALHWKDELPARPLLFCAAVFTVGLLAGKTSALFALSGIYPLIWICTQQIAQMPSLHRFGDISYGTYLYGWPIQQVCRALIGPGSAGELFVLSSSLAALAGLLSWHAIESRALRWRPYRGRGVPEPCKSSPPYQEDAG